MKSLKELIPKVVAQTATATEAARQLQQDWPKLVGKTLARHTRPGSLRRKTLCIFTDDPGAGFLLALEKPRLLTKLRACAHSEIEDIIIRPGDMHA